MKVYELMNYLSSCPAGADIEIGTSGSKQKMIVEADINEDNVSLDCTKQVTVDSDDSVVTLFGRID